MHRWAMSRVRIESRCVGSACTIKPWERSRTAWRTLAWCRSKNDTNPMCMPCLATNVEKWFAAEDRVCGALERAAGETQAESVPALDAAGARQLVDARDVLQARNELRWCAREGQSRGAAAAAGLAKSSPLGPHKVPRPEARQVMVLET